MKPGTPVTNVEPLHDGPHTIPPGTLGVIEWCDRARGEAAVQFIGYILQRGVDVAALRECTPWLASAPAPDIDAALADHISARCAAIGFSAEQAVDAIGHLSIDRPVTARDEYPPIDDPLDWQRRREASSAPLNMRGSARFWRTVERYGLRVWYRDGAPEFTTIVFELAPGLGLELSTKEDDAWIRFAFVELVEEAET